MRKHQKESHAFSSMEKITHAINTQQGTPLAYGTSDKCPMEIILDGHNFRYIFNKDEYRIYRCCYQLKKKECSAKIVRFKNLAYVLDGKHSHKLPDTVKNVTSLHVADKTPIILKVKPSNLEVEKSIPDYLDIKIKDEIIPHDESLEFTDEVQNKTLLIEDPKEFREKIKERLQKRLTRKTKKLQK